jgi:cytochrome c
MQILCDLFILTVIGVTSVHAELRGHGGPVRALAISADGATAVSGSFDTSAIRWSLTRNAAEEVLRFHDGAVNAVAMLRDGRIATAGEDGRSAVWTPGRAMPDAVLTGHQGPVVALAVAPDGAALASASWDRTVRVWSLAGGAPRLLQGHQQNVNGIAFTPDGRNIVSAGYDATIRIWPVAGFDPPAVATLASPLNAVAVAPDGEIIAAGADGRIYFLAADAALRDEIELQPAPLLALAISPDGARIAAAGIRGSIAIVERQSRRLLRVLVGPGLPVWAVAFLPDNHTLLTGGADGVIRWWNADTGESIGANLLENRADPLSSYADDPGARVFRACVACHALKAEEANRAGPTLHGLFGRRIAILPGYNFSEALKRLDIVWTPETVARLFELGPAAYTPGTEMPEQRIGAPQDRDELVRFLERATK